MFFGQSRKESDEPSGNNRVIGDVDVTVTQEILILRKRGGSEIYSPENSLLLCWRLKRNCIDG